MKIYENQISFPDRWLSKIPGHWQTHKMKRLFDERSEKGYPQEPLLVASQNMGVIPKALYGTRTVEAQKDLHLLKRVHVGDFVISLRSFQGGLEYAYYQGIISPAYTILVPHAPILATYFRYLAKCKPFIGLLTLCVTGIREGQNVDYTKLRNHILPVPPRAEQDQIVRFLDWKVSEINKLIGIRKKEVVALKELNEAIIEKAITIGIDEVTVFKFTGLNYLPEIPEAWVLLKLKHVCKVGASITKKLKQYADQDRVVFLPMENISVDGEIDCSMKLPISEVKSGFSSFAKGDVIVAKITPCFENGKGACLNALESEIGYGTTELFNLRPFNNILSEYLYYVTKTKLFRVLGEGRMTGSAGQKRVSGEFIKNFMIGIPSIKEQQKIINYILQKTSGLKRQIEIKKEQIQQLLELKNTIISDVVTGKIDVRNVVIPEYEHIDDAADAAGGEESAEELADAEEMEA